MKRFKQFFLRMLCYIFSFIMTISVIGVFFFGLSSVTIGNKNYLCNAFMNGETTSALYASLKEDIKTVSQQTKIPEEVLTRAVASDFVRNVQTTVIKNIYSGQNESFEASSDLRERYQTSIENYFKENKIKYTQEQLNEAVDLAVEAFNENCAIKNNSELSPYANFIRTGSVKFTLMFLASIFVCIFMIYAFNGKSRKAFNYVAMAFMTAGEIMIALPAVSIAFELLNRFSFTNIEAYNRTINQTLNTMLLISIIVGVVFVGIAISIFSVNYKYYSYKFLKSETEYEIYKNLT